jgi:CRISPR-associated endonuclease Cas2
MTRKELILSNLVHESHMLTLVIYDITNDRNRTDLAGLLQNYGLHRIQYSGFLGDLNPNDREILSNEVKKFVNGENDSVYVIPLCDKDTKACRIVSNKGIACVTEKGAVTIIS